MFRNFSLIFVAIHCLGLSTHPNVIVLLSNLLLVLKVLLHVYSAHHKDSLPGPESDGVNNHLCPLPIDIISVHVKYRYT